MLTTRQLQTFIDVASGNGLKTPFMLTDKAIIRQQCLTFRKLFPRVKLFYAVKCFSDPDVIKATSPYVDGYDIASVKEVEALLKVGIDPSRMTFSNPVKSEDALKKASALKVRRFAFQSNNELVKIVKHAPGSEVYVRVKMPDSKGAINFSTKFGCALEEVVPLLLTAKKLGLVPIGLTFHVGSQAIDLTAWPEALKKSHEIIEKARLNGIDAHVVNIGGGFPVRYTDQDPKIDAVANYVNRNLAPQALGLTYMAEPGRFIAADSSVIVASVIGVEDRGDTTWLYLDVGAFHAFFEVFQFKKFLYPVYSLDHLSRGIAAKKRKKYVLTGPTCDSDDTMAWGVELPEDIAVGSKLLFASTGAYTVVYGSEFNGFTVPPRRFFDSEDMGIVKREKKEDVRVVV